MSGCEVGNVQEQIPYEAEKHRPYGQTLQACKFSLHLANTFSFTVYDKHSENSCFAMVSSFGVTTNAKRWPIIKLHTYKYRKKVCTMNNVLLSSVNFTVKVAHGAI